MSKIVKFVAVSLLGFSLAIAISIHLFPTSLVAQSSQKIPLIQQGIELYEAEQFERAVKVWDMALTQEDDNLGKSFIFSSKRRPSAMPMG